jgi:hypothetical protein
MKKLRKIIMLSILIAVFLSLPSDLNNIINTNDTSNSDSLSELTEAESAGTGIYETKNFIPDGGSRFQSYGGLEPRWSYPGAQTYSDTFWGAPDTLVDGKQTNWKTVQQSLTQDNRYFSDAASQVLGSTDFAQSDYLGVGSIRVDPAKRARDFLTNDTDGLNPTYSIVENKPAVVGLLSGNRKAASTWVTAGISSAASDYYPGNREGSSGTWYLLNNENWAYGNSRMTPTRAITTNTLSAVSNRRLEFDFNRKTWYSLSWPQTLSTRDRTYTITGTWDSSAVYEVELIQQFYYNGTSPSTNARYGADIAISPNGDLKPTTVPEGTYNVDITGNVSYNIYKTTGGTQKIVTGPIYYFGDNDATGQFNRTDLSVIQSANFGSSLDSGWYYLSIKVSITHRQFGSISKTASGRSIRVEAYGETDLGINVQISNPRITITESNPVTVSPQGTELLVTSDWVPWGADRNIISGFTPALVFGYQVPSTFMGYNGGSETLQFGRIVAYLEIDRPGGPITYRNESLLTFADVRGQNLGFGTGCARYIWPMDSSVQTNLNGATAIRWRIGIIIRPGLELSYNSDTYSRIYLNNINFNVTTEVKIGGTFTLRNLIGYVEEPTPLNFAIFNNDDYFSRQTTNGSVVMSGLYNGTVSNPWRVTVNVSIGGSDYFIYNSSYLLNRSTNTFSDTLILNLTNIVYHIRNHAGSPIGPGAVIQFASLTNPQDIRTEITDINSNVTFREVYNGNWRLIVNVTEAGESLTVFNATRTINTLGLGFPEKYLVTASSDNIVTANLTNIRCEVKDANGVALSGVTVTTRNSADLSQIQSNITNGTGMTIIRSLASGNYRITVNRNGYTVLNFTTDVTANANLSLLSKYTDLTNLVLTVRDYGSVILDNSANPIATFTNGTDTRIQPISNGLVNFLEIRNSSAWNLMINVTVLGNSYTIFNAPYGISTAAEMINQTVTANLTTVEFTVYDKDSAIVPNALVFLNNPMMTYNEMRVTDSSGKVIFRNLYYLTNWNLTVKYVVQGTGSSDFVNYTIFADAAYSQINPQTNQDFRLTRNILNCNLTSFNFWVVKNDLNDLTYALGAANLSIRLGDSESIIASYLSSSVAPVTMRLPIDTYNFSIDYLDQLRQFDFNDTLDGEANWKIRFVNQSITVRLLVNVNMPVTALEVVDWSFANPSWPNSTNFNTVPYTISMYYNDTIRFTLRYFLASDLSDMNENGANIGNSIWQITPQDNIALIMNSSSTVPSVTVPGMYNGTPGFFDFVLNSSQYPAGVYRLTFIFKQSGYIDAIYEITVQIMNHTTSLVTVGSLSALSVFSGENLVIWMNYTTVVPEIANASAAMISYSIYNTALTGNFVPQGSTSSLYSLVLPTNDLLIGVYQIEITAVQGNLTAKTITQFVEIKALPTTTATLIPTENRLNPSSMRVSYGENFTVLFNYTYSNLSMVAGVQFSIYLNNPATPVSYYSYLGGNYLYNITAPASQYPIGNHLLYIVCSATNTVNYTLVINIEIIESWSTRVDIVTPPEFTPWGNNATFVIDYVSTDSPRSNQKLTGASISQLKITYIENSIEYTVRTLYASDVLLWRWLEIQPGRYQIWFNTSILTVTGNKFFYAIPTLSYSVYAEGNPRPYVWVSPLETSFTVFADGQELTQLSMFKDAQKVISAYLNVTKSDSTLLGNTISNAQARYMVYNASNVLIASGDLLPRGNGLYEVELTASRLGTYRVDISMTLTNYTLSKVASFNWVVSYIPVNFRTTIDSSIRLSSSSIKLARGENIQFEIAFLEQMTSYPNLYVYINETLLPVTNMGNGVYKVNVPASNFNVSEYVIRIQASKEFTETVEQTLDLTILDYWATGTELMDPPTVYPWNNISSFIYRYYCVESPRSGFALADAGITNLNITYVGTDGEVTERFLTASDIAKGIWGWSNLKDEPNYVGGYYYVWVNTSILTIDEGKFFYLIPTINQSIYAPARIRPYVWITPVQSEVTVLESNVSLAPRQTFNLYLDESIIVYIRANVTDSASILFGTTITDAEIYMDMFMGSDYIRTEQILHEGDGIYAIEIPAITIGNFLIDVYAFKQNFTFKAASFNYIVSPKPIALENKIGISGNTVTVPQNRPFEFSLDLFDSVGNTAFSNATMNVTINSKNFTFYEDPEVPGRYTARLSADEIGQFDVTSYTVRVEVSKVNYTSHVETFTLAVSFPVDPIFDFPLPYWRLGGIVAAIMASVLILQRSIRYARIPLYVKQLDATRKAITKKKAIPPERLTLQMVDEMAEKYGSRWQYLGLNMKDLIKPAVTKSDATSGDSGDKFMSPGDAGSDQTGGDD